MYKTNEEKFPKIILGIILVICGVLFGGLIINHMIWVDKSIEAYEKRQEQDVYIPEDIIIKRDEVKSDGIDTNQDLYFNSFKDAQVAYLNAYLQSNYEKSFVIVNNILNQNKDGELKLNQEEQLIAQFNLYDSNLQILTTDKYDYMYNDISAKYEVIDFIMSQILSYQEDIELYKIITSNSYLSKIFNFAKKYENTKLKK